VVRFETRDGKPIALIVNYASHAEVMFRSVTRNGGYEVSGDLPGAVSRLLETQATAPIVLFTSGAEADQLTLFKSLQYAGRLPAADEGSAGWALLDVQARRLAESVTQVLSEMPGGVMPVRISPAATSVTCPGQQLSIDPKSGQTTTEDKPPVTIPLSMIRINDIVLAGVGGDVATEIGQHFKAASRLHDSIFISMAGSSVGYIFADASYAHPGHGLTKSLLKSNCADHAIVNGLVRMIDATGQP
jgi:neutral ceramidase